MRLIQSREIRMENLWEPELFGVFSTCCEKVVFYFINRQILYSYEDGDHSPRVFQMHSDGNAFPLPYRWQLLKTPTASFLIMKESLGINLTEKTQVSSFSDDLLLEYKKRCTSEKHFEEDAFCFDDYRISHKGLSGYTCTKREAHLWDFSGRAYLYTDMKRYQDKIYFGTGGNSGYFYILNLDTGVPVAKIKTGGTSCMERIGDFCYFLQYDGKTSLLCVDIHSGNVVEQVSLPGKCTELSRMQIIRNKVQAITFQYNRGTLHSAIWTTIQL